MKKENFMERVETREEKLINLLKTKGVENEEVMTELISWTKSQEDEAMKSADSEKMLQLNLKRAKIYFQAGYFDEAIENIEAVLVQAQHEDRHDLYNKALGELQSFKQEQILREH